MKRSIQNLPSLALLCSALASCALVSPVGRTPSDNREPTAGGYTQIRPLSTGDLSQQPTSRLIADLLFAGLQALDDDRLLMPLDDNAHARFQRVLAYEPDNEIALQGLRDIVARYLQLAEDASQQGLFDEAQLMLDRARFVDAGHPDIAAVAQVIAQERNSGDLFFEFEADTLAGRGDAMRSQLAAIAQQARAHNAFFLITAPNDEQARWMFSVMREAVPGYRLRGNIELASRTAIRLRMPQEND